MVTGGTPEVHDRLPHSVHEQSQVVKTLPEEAALFVCRHSYIMSTVMNHTYHP